MMMEVHRAPTSEAPCCLSFLINTSVWLLHGYSVQKVEWCAGFQGSRALAVQMQHLGLRG